MLRGWALVGIVLASAPAPAFAADLGKKEKACLGKVGAATRRFAKLLTERKEYASARAELCRFLLLDPEDAATRQQLAQLVKKGRVTDAGSDVSIARRAARAECTKALLDFAAECEKAGDLERLWRAWTGAVFAYEATLPEGAEWFAPYGVFVRKEDKERLDAGGEYVDGKWLDATEMSALDAKHRTAKGEWVLEDDVHVVRTAEPLRSARRVLYQAGAFRRFFLAHFACWWDLRPPQGKLPIVFTGTQEEIRKKVAEYDPASSKDAADQLSAALYLWSNMPLNPCFVTLEPMLVSGEAHKLTFEEIEQTLRHELAHQIAYEYSRHANPTPQPSGQPWLAEGMAEFLSCYVPGPTGWRLEEDNETFARCREKADAMPKLADFVRLPKASFDTVELYAMGACFYRFLWEADAGRHRAAIARVTELVHQSKATAATFKECFKADPASLQPAWDEFVRTLGPPQAVAPEGDDGTSEDG